MPEPKVTGGLILRDQQRALHAYEAVSGIPESEREPYWTAVSNLGPHILRGGLCAALAGLQRLGKRGESLMGHLAAARVPGLVGATKEDLAKKARELDSEAYIIATRELLQVATWLKRAAQASFGGE